MFVCMPAHAKALLIAVLAASCGGGGGGGPTPPAANELKLTLNNVTISATETSGSLTVALADFAPTLQPALVQFDLLIDPPLVQVDPTSPLTALQTLETLDGDFIPGGFRIVCGYGESATAQTLPSGPLFQVPFL